jgi:hypothetical protein
MPDTFVVSGLRRKRAHLAGEIELAQRLIDKQRGTLATLDAVIRLFEPQSNPELIASIRPAGQRCLFFRRGEQTRLCVSALREAGKPVTTRQVADYAMAAKGLDPEPRVRERIIEHVRGTLTRLADKGVTRKIVERPDVWWELVGSGESSLD